MNALGHVTVSATANPKTRLPLAPEFLHNGSTNETTTVTVKKNPPSSQ